MIDLVIAIPGGALVANHLRAGSRDSLDTCFAQWSGWLADVHLSHVRFSGLVYHRPVGRLTWSTALSP